MAQAFFGGVHPHDMKAATNEKAIEQLAAPAEVDEVIQQIDDLAELAPVHNHPHALALRACKKVIPATTPQVVVFDTAFHSTMPEKAFMYGLPYECYEKLHVRKYGFHGTSHRFVSQRTVLSARPVTP